MNTEYSPEELLRRILRHPLFRDAGDQPSLLEFLCYRTQSGNLDTLHEHDIGVEVFGLEPGYDVRENPIVSRTAGELRERLQQYFELEGRREPIRLAIPKGEFRAFFYEADPSQLSPGEPAGVEIFWAPHWQSPSATLLLHGELPGDTIAIPEAYAATMIAMLFHKQDQRLELHPAGAFADESLARRNLIVLGTVESNPLVSRFHAGLPQTAIAERIAPTAEHGWITLLSAPEPAGLLDAARFATEPGHLEKTIEQYGAAGLPPFFRLTIIH